MNIRSLTRGDAAVIAAAVLLFIASFLNFYTVDTGQMGGSADEENGWASELFPVLPSIYLAGIAGAALIVFGRALAGRTFAGLDLGQLGVGAVLFATWTALWTMFDNPIKNIGGDQIELGSGHILAFISLLVMSGAAIATPLVPALKAPLTGGTPGQPGPYGGAPYGGQPQGGYGYPGGPQAGQPGPYGAQQQPAAQQPGGGAPGAPDPNFQPFWFAVPVARPLYAEDGSPQPVAELAPGTWYLAVEQRGQALVAQTQDGRRGVLQDTSGIQRG
ncbi:hypothetical protein E0L36_03715 [Streptomyces sp. AJS327]|uniref:hypothetical protein n=1 Tax=Streptomyces sp. AJS327 TaxID=2545265 RepID=UPI0015DFB62C|nr:hypothetical protein [Streptomyces sp. AJS327]MBA0050036.1 hypothetical protein [Streptomyces sp. AJS327]